MPGEQRYSCSDREIYAKQVEKFKKCTGINIEDYMMNDDISNVFGGNEERAKCVRLLSNIKDHTIPEDQGGNLLLNIEFYNDYSLREKIKEENNYV